MKKTVIVLFTVGVSAIQCIYGQNSEIRNLESFNKITVSGNAKVNLTPGPTQQVRVETDKELSDVKTNVNDGKLKIDGRASSVYITVPAIENITVSGYGDVKADSAFSGKSIELNISGKGKITAYLTFQELEVNMSGFGKMKLNGQVHTLHLNVSGNGVLDAENLKAVVADVQISGVGKAKVDVSDQLDLGISGVGSVYYKTEPKVINRNISGIGKYGLIAKDAADTTTVHLGNKRIMIIGNEEKKMDNDENNKDVNIDIDTDDNTHPKKSAKARSHWGGFDLGFANYFTDGTSTSLPIGYNDLDLNTGKSIHVGLNLFEHDFKLYKRYLMFTTGIGLSLDNYRFNTNRVLRADSIPIEFGADKNDIGEPISYKKNKLAVNYITVPILLQFNSNERLKKSIHVGAGILLSYKYNSHLKLVYDKNGDKQKVKRQDDFNIEPFRYDATVRIGYRNYTLFGSYAISELFKDKRGPTLHPFNVGFQLAGW